MATYNLGQAAIVMKGAYASGTAYLPLNCVSNDGGSWICKKACTGIEPGVTSGWATYWVAAAVGIKNINISSTTAGTATVVITFTDNSTSSFTYDTSAIADKAVTPEKLDRVYESIGLRTAIPSGADLNNYSAVGNFACTSAGIAANIANAPVTNRIFTLDVKNVQGNRDTEKPSGGYYYILQKIETARGEQWVRRGYQENSDTLNWDSWKRELTSDDLYSPLTSKTTGNITATDIGATLISSYNTAVTYTITQENSSMIPVGAEIAVFRYATGTAATKIVGSGVRFAIPGESAFLANKTLILPDTLGMVVLKKIINNPSLGDIWHVAGKVEAV